MAPNPNEISQWYQDQVVFLTGGTGTLGGCLLYKLALQVCAKKIFVLCRGSVHEAIEKLEDSMPDEAHNILDTQKVSFVVGDVTESNLGLRGADLQQLQAQVTVVINCAASVSLLQNQHGSVTSNCLPHLRLMKLLRNFSKLKTLLHVSTAFVNSFLPGGRVEERIYDIYDDKECPANDLHSIISTGHSQYNSQFPAPYAHAKYIAERLILENPCLFSVLIVRPSNIGPAIRDPAPFYGLDMTIPMHSYVQFLLSSSDTDVRNLDDILPPQHIVDEIPVDLVANTCLLHLASGTTGIVQAAANLYIPRTSADIQRLVDDHLSPELEEELRTVGYSQNPELAKYFTRMFERFCRNWDFDCGRSESLKGIDGPLSLSLEGHDPEQYAKVRIQAVARRLRASFKNSGKPSSVT
ncbi:hypothetical protein ETB97_007253 [Aspergillus alliaceus]|uniref:Fatty acyl-CoA reductase n=1 Tax=Petromyces alliaceus TaxID=209559 RepID=A0A8H5ZVK8_PETAA|nr:hypothetical protein ETB97_007253 [Aspergillus burnettii]